MSHAAIAAVLARDDLAAGERLVAWSLASFANRDQVAWPGLAAATSRAGLGRSRYLDARDGLVHRGLLHIEQQGTGRGQTTVVRLLFAQSGPWWDGEVNVELAEAVLGHTRERGPARLLLATLAALSDANGSLCEITTAELCHAAGLANSSYRRARLALLASGEVVVDEDSGGRGRTSRWTVRCPSALDAQPQVSRRRRTLRRAGDRPLVAVVRDTNSSAGARAAAEMGAIPGAVSDDKGPVLSGVSRANPAETPPQTPPLNARAGGEPLNPRTQNPPNPPRRGGSSDTAIFVEETYRTDHARRRRRRVAIDPDALCNGYTAPSPTDADDWKRIRDLVRARVGDSTFEIWFARVDLRAVDAAGAPVLDAPDATRAWVWSRFGPLLRKTGAELGRPVVLSDERLSRAMQALGFDLGGIDSTPATAVRPSDVSYDASACSLSYTPAYTQAKEVGRW